MNEGVSGNLARLGLVDDDRRYACADLLKRMEADGLETVRFLFADQHGILRGKAIVAAAAGPRTHLDRLPRRPARANSIDVDCRTEYP